MSWYGTFRAELEGASVPSGEAAELVAAARAEAEASETAPEVMYGPAVVYAREIAAAARSEEPARQPDLGPEPGEPLLQLRGVSVRRGRRQVLSDVNLTVRRGEVVAVVGANGAGKSTLLQVCAGLLKPDQGSVRRVADFGYAPQHMVQAPMLSIQEHLQLFGAARSMPSRAAVATGTRILNGLGWKPDPHQLVGTLSGGSQQKVNVALAQLHSPSLLLLDEPYQGFDTLAHDDLWSLIAAWRRAGAGVLVITHLLRDATCVDRVLELPTPEEGFR